MSKQVCANCGFENGKNRISCRECNVSLKDAALNQGVTGEPVSIEERRKKLQEHIDMYVAQGYTVQSQTESTAQLVGKKPFSWFLFILLLGFLYLIMYAVSPTPTAYIRVDEYGRVTIT